MGAAVEAKFGGRGKFYPGKIEAVNADGTFVILFDDGDKEPIATREEIKLVVGEGGGPAVAAAIAGKRSLPEATEDDAEPPRGAAPASSAEAMQKRVVVREGRHTGRVGVVVKAANGHITIRPDAPGDGDEFFARLSELELLGDGAGGETGGDAVAKTSGDAENDAALEGGADGDDSREKPGSNKRARTDDFDQKS